MTTLRRLPWVLSSLDDPRESVGFVGPNWYASVMGTGIVAIAVTTLPILGSDLHVFAEVVWVVAVLLLVGVTGAVTAHWLRHPQVARGHARDPNMAQFYGAPPMALMTVGAGTLLVGPSLIGTSIAVTLD